MAEAAAAGLPIICTDKCGARHEVVKENGIVVPAGDAAALAEAMGRISSVGVRELGVRRLLPDAKDVEADLAERSNVETVARVEDQGRLSH